MAVKRDFHKLLATISALSPPQLTGLDAAIREFPCN